MSIRLTTAAVPLTAALWITGCSSSGPAAVTGSGGEPQEGGVLQVAMSADYSCLDGQQARGNELNISNQIVDGLTAQHAETGEIHPHLAEAWEINEDASEFTFHLRDDVTFHNGAEFTAESVERNFEEIANLGARSSLGQTYLAGLEEIEVIDDHTVRVVFEQPNAQFLQATSTVTLGFYADETLDELSVEERCQGEVIGTGPFVFDSYTGQNTVELSRNEDYNWATEIAKQEGPANLEGIEFTVMPEASVRNGSLASGQVDIDTEVTVQDESGLESQGFPIYAHANPGAPTNLWVNVTDEPVDDVDVRQAINFALDRDELASVEFDNQDGAKNTVAQSTPGFSPQEDLLAFDPARAEELLDEAGWELGSDGVREKDGERLEIEIVDYYQPNYLELVQEQLNNVGFDAEINTVTFSERSSILENGEYQLITGRLTRADADIIRTVHAFDQQNTNQREEPEEIDDLLAETLSVVDDEQRAEALLGDVSQVLLEEGYSIPMVEHLTVWGTGQNIHDFRFDPTARADFYDTWIEE